MSNPAQDSTPDIPRLNVGGFPFWNSSPRKKIKSFADYIREWEEAGNSLPAADYLRFEDMYKQLGATFKSALKGQNFYQAPLSLPLSVRDIHIETIVHLCGYVSLTDKSGEFKTVTGSGIFKATPKSVEFVASRAAGQDGAPQFTPEDAEAMVLLAFQNKKFLGKNGVRIEGSPQQIILIQQAIEKINSAYAASGPGAPEMVIRNGIGPLKVKRKGQKATSSASAAEPGDNDTPPQAQTGTESPEVDEEQEKARKEFYASDIGVEIKKSIAEIYAQDNKSDTQKLQTLAETLAKHQDILTDDASHMFDQYSDDGAPIFKFEMHEKKAGLPENIYFSRNSDGIEIRKIEIDGKEIVPEKEAAAEQQAEPENVKEASAKSNEPPAAEAAPKKKSTSKTKKSFDKAAEGKPVKEATPQPEDAQPKPTLRRRAKPSGPKIH